MATTLHAYLGFPGTCAEAMRFYARTLGGELKVLVRHGDAPGSEGMPEGAKNRIMHAYLVTPDFELMAGDAPEGAARMEGFMLALSYDSVDQAKRIFDALADGGKITMPPAETFWARYFGMCVDKYGTAWGVNGGPKPMP